MIVTNPTPKFMAVTINITFETQQEVDLIKTLMAMQVAIPGLIACSTAERMCLEGMMNKILSKLPA